MFKERRRARLAAWWIVLAFTLLAVSACVPTGNGTDVSGLSTISIGVNPSAKPGDIGMDFQIVGLLTILALAPSILMMVTSFTRIIIVLSLIRNAIGIPQLPPNQVLLGLSLFLTFFVMAPTWNTINHDALQPYMAGDMSQTDAIHHASYPVRQFMFRQTGENDLALFVYLAKLPQPRNENDIPTYVLVPSFITSELKTAFEMGFIIFIPFLVIDLVVSSTLMSMGMMMLPPVVISLPFKLLLFVLADGWTLIVRSLVMSFH